MEFYFSAHIAHITLIKPATSQKRHSLGRFAACEVHRLATNRGVVPPGDSYVGLWLTWYNM